MSDIIILIYALLVMQLLSIIVIGVMFFSEKKTRKALAKNRKALEASLTENASAFKSLADDVEEARRDLSEAKQDLARAVEASSRASAQSVADASEREENRFEAMRTSVENIRGSVDKQLEALRADNSLQLERMRQTVDEKLQEGLDRRLTKSFAMVQESLEQVYKGLGEMQGLAQGVGDLKRVLGNVKKRGILGELQLKAILEQLLAPGQYIENSLIDPASAERVEFAVKLPGDGDAPVLLPIDAKFPADAYARVSEAAESGDPSALAEARRILYAAVKKDARDIQEKYIKPPFSTEFAILFLPFEGLYAEVVNMGLMEEVQAEYHVMLAGPSTMAAMLNSLQMGFKALAIRQNANQVWKVLSTVKSEFDKFAAVLELTQSRLDQANKELDKLVGTRTRMIQKSLKQIQSLEELEADPNTLQSSLLEDEDIFA